jgi:hypothetical protein
MKFCFGIYIMKCWMELMLDFVSFLAFTGHTKNLYIAKKKYVGKVSF